MLALILCDEADETALLGMAAQRAGASLQSTTRLELAVQTLERDEVDLVIAAVRTGALVDTSRRIRLASNAPLAASHSRTLPSCPADATAA